MVPSHRVGKNGPSKRLRGRSITTIKVNKGKQRMSRRHIIRNTHTHAGREVHVDILHAVRLPRYVGTCKCWYLTKDANTL